MNSIGIGGQAVVNGVMLKSEDTYAIAMKNENTDEVEVIYDKHKGILGTGVFGKIPILRGVFKIIDDLLLGSEVVTRSAEFYEEKQQENMSDSAKSGKGGDVLFIIAFIIALVLAFVAFVVGPLKLTEFVGKKFLEDDNKKRLCELAIRIVLFILYAYILSIFGEVNKLTKYRGACNKVKNCIRSGQAVNLENVKMCSKIDRSNRSSFVLTVVFVSSMLFTFLSASLTREDKTMMVLARFVAIFAVAAILYEIFSIFKEKRGLGMIFGLPDTLVQLLFTKNPTDEMLRVAMCAATAILEKDKVMSSTEEYNNGYNSGLNNTYQDDSYAMNNDEYPDNNYANGQYDPVRVSYNDDNAFNDMGYGKDNFGAGDEMYPPVDRMPEHENYDDFDYNNNMYADNYANALEDKSFSDREYNRALAYGNIQASEPNLNDGLDNSMYDTGIELQTDNNLYDDDNGFNDPYGFGNNSNMMLEDMEYDKNVNMHGNYNNNSIGNYADLQMDNYDDFSSKSDYYEDENDKRAFRQPYGEEDDDVLDALDRMFDDDY